MELTIQDQHECMLFGERLGSCLRGGDVIELVGDVGAGKTTLVKAIADGMGVQGDVSSPSYTLSQVYEATDERRLVHYDFYRLSDPGILANELEEALSMPGTIVAIEWGAIVAGVIPSDHLRIEIQPLSETARKLIFTAAGERSNQIIGELQ